MRTISAAGNEISGLPAETPAADTPRTLADLRDRARPLLLFAGPKIHRQLELLAEHPAELRERQMPVLVIRGAHTSPENGAGTAPGSDTDLPEDNSKALHVLHFAPVEEARLRQLYTVREGEFTLILIGKDGESKLRSTEPIAWQQLQELVDSMPMRQQEIRERGSH